MTGSFLSGLAAYAGGFFTATGVAAMFAFLGKATVEGWLKSKFDKELESFKHRQDLEIEGVRHRFSALVDRKIKLNQQEFSTLPGLWLSMNIAFSEVSSYTSPMQEYLSLDRMDSEQLDEWLDKQEYPESTKKRIREAATSQRNDVRDELTSWPRYNKAFAAFADFNNKLIDDTLFLSPEMDVKLGQMKEWIHGALVEKKISLQMGEKFPKQHTHADTLRNDGPPLRLEIRAMLRDRLWKDASEHQH